MKSFLWTIAIAWLPLTATIAAPWSFSQAVEVTSVSSGKVFHHLDASGRRNIAAAHAGVAVAWEDDRDGTPRVYLAYKGYVEDRFTRELQVSGSGEAFEPSLIALGGERFAIAWEEADAVWLRLADMKADEPRLGPPLKISKRQGGQANLTTGNNSQVIVLWSEREGRYGRIRAQYLRLQGLQASVETDCPVDAAAPSDEQLYPAATVVQGRLLVAWEDRRPKHTIIMAASERQPGACRFSEPARISEKPAGRNLPYGSGHGVARVAIDRVGEKAAFAAWADKRAFRNGYDIWGSHYLSETGRFGGNERVQDDFGGLSKQRHATVAGHAGGVLVVAWDDEREGNADLMLSWHEDDGWSDDWPLPVASGAGEQSHPTIVLDPQGNLHAAWIERDAVGGVTRLKYGFGKLTGAD
jgi:hypothetical protein